ncbi:MAG TPA: 5'/3'-nucleotidase SurE [bacterium]|nr:5'/3'-nucleotidase SurE [bacterium]
MKILLTNDDGIKSRGLEALKRALEDSFKIVIVAPANEKSASSHAISLGQKLRVEKIGGSKIAQYAVHGTPADCVKFALSELEDFTPDLIISGINQGANTGVSVYYSGTISAAREGVINRIPSMAVSLCSKSSADFTVSAKVAKSLAEGCVLNPLPRNTMLNVNVPALPHDKIKGIRVTKQAASRFIEEFIREKEHQGKQVYSLAGEIELYDPDGKSDEEAVLEGFISVTPLRLDLTDYQVMPNLEQWVKRDLL